MRLRWVRPAAAAFALAGAAACTIPILGSDDDEETRRETVLEDVSYDDAWSAILRTFADLDLPIESVEKESGLVTTDWILLDDPEDSIDCDEGYRNAEIRLNVFLRETDAGQEMTLVTSARAESVEGDRTRCRSTGELEEAIQRGVRRRA